MRYPPRGRDRYIYVDNNSLHHDSLTILFTSNFKPKKKKKWDELSRPHARAPAEGLLSSSCALKLLVLEVRASTQLAESRSRTATVQVLWPYVRSVDTKSPPIFSSKTFSTSGERDRKKNKSGAPFPKHCVAGAPRSVGGVLDQDV